MQEWMQGFLSSDEPPHHVIEDALLDFGFYHTPLQVQRMYAELTNRNHYGYAGGVLDQPPEYWHDMATMQWLKLYVEHVLPQAGLIPQHDVIEQLKRTGKMNGIA